MLTIYSRTSGLKASSVLVDEGERLTPGGTLDRGLLLPNEWLTSLVAFVGDILPRWRDDPRRQKETGETRLTAQLCSHLNSACRHARWDFVQFKREEPDEVENARSIDLVAAPRGAVIWLAGREHSEYQTLLPIECKRLPVPSGPTRDEREYLYSRHRSTGGVQRFKAGHHGAGHSRAAMIGYVQCRDIDYWRVRLDSWIDELVSVPTPGWSGSDRIALVTYDRAARVASLQSTHGRGSELEPIAIDHLWIEM